MAKFFNLVKWLVFSTTLAAAELRPFMFFVMKCIGKSAELGGALHFLLMMESQKSAVFFLIRSLSRSFGSKWAFRAKFMAIDNEKEVEISSRSSKICAISRFGSRQFNAHCEDDVVFSKY